MKGDIEIEALIATNSCKRVVVNIIHNAHEFYSIIDFHISSKR
jgi:hypothetical protein